MWCRECDFLRDLQAHRFVYFIYITSRYARLQSWHETARSRNTCASPRIVVVFVPNVLLSPFFIVRISHNLAHGMMRAMSDQNLMWCHNKIGEFYLHKCVTRAMTKYTQTSAVDRRKHFQRFSLASTKTHDDENEAKKSSSLKNAPKIVEMMLKTWASHAQKKTKT